MLNAIWLNPEYTLGTVVMPSVLASELKTFADRSLA